VNGVQILTLLFPIKAVVFIIIAGIMMSIEQASPHANTQQNRLKSVENTVWRLKTRKAQIINSSGEKSRNKGGSANIPNLRTLTEFIYALRNDKIIFQVQKLIS
jgi:hypothetical protein